MSETTTKKERLAKERAEERRQERERLDLLMHDYRAGDVDRFLHNMTWDDFPWALALKWFAKLTSVPAEMQEAFQFAWIEYKQISRVNNQPLICAAARVMLPPYTGPAVLLFRGASLLERRRRAYGVSWTDSLAAAEDFAKDYQVWPGGSVVLETLASPAAIVGKMPYPKPFTEEERAQYPGAHFLKRHEEREYIVDRRQLTRVKVIRHLPEATPAKIRS